MKTFDPSLLKQLYVPDPSSHKGQNGKLLIIAGSKLFHSASLWPLTIASRILDMVYFSSVSENNEVVTSLKEEFRNGIIVPRNKVESYIEEAECILIGPGLPRVEGQEEGDDDTKELTERLLKKYPHKKWVIDGGSLQVIEPELLPADSIVTPHPREFDLLKSKIQNSELRITIENAELEKQVELFAKEFGCIILLKGQVDLVASSTKVIQVAGGNAGMTKGGTGDVLAGLTASLYCKNDAFLSAAAASYINKKAGEELSKTMGLYFNASDLALEIPKVMKNLLS